ncbi:MAG: type IV pilus secretin PilQ [Deltaproteobacteria bacterium]|jgi:type IV pilus assembly protein PilQ|nr:type IV pilus secretin PilQ [Deltaproteobacteria bacterium]
MKNSPKNRPRVFSYLLTLVISVIFLGAGLASAQTFAPAADPPPPVPGGTAGGQGSGVSPGGTASTTGMLLVDPYSGLNSNKVYTGERISLDFQNADIHNILRLIGEVSGKNVVVSDQVSGRVTLKLKNVPWDQALDIVLASKNLGVIENGNVLRIDTMDAIRRSVPDTSDPAVRVPLIKKIFTPKYSSVSSLASEMDKGKSMRGSVKVIGNDIYVEDDMDTMAAITEIFRRNDRVTKQILIEARIVEATTQFRQTLGIRWGGGFDRVTGHGTGAGSTSNLGTQYTASSNYKPGEIFGALDVGQSDTISGSLGFGFLNRAGTLMLHAELNAFESVGENRIISAPRIMASNDQEVYIKQGQQIPYVSGGTTAGTTASTEFKDASLELRVTPHIEENGEIVTLDITLTKDSVGTTLLDNGELPIDTNEASTKLMVKNGETVVIGGIIADSSQDTNVRVPGVHAIPLLGWLFKNRSVTNIKAELLIFITANIIPITI